MDVVEICAALRRARDKATQVIVQYVIHVHNK